jgi:hypothetical protein
LPPPILIGKGHAVALSGGEGRGQIQTPSHILRGFLDVAIILRVIVLVVIFFFCWRFDIADRSPALRVSLCQEFEDGGDGVAVASSFDIKFHIGFVAPVEAAGGVAEQHFGGFEKAQTGEDLARIE